MAIAKTEITSPAIARGTDKITHQVYYVVRSDSSDDWHQVTWSNELIAWQCNGEKCKKYQVNGTTCKHARAVNEVLRIRRATIALAMGGQVPAIVAKLQRERPPHNLLHVVGQSKRAKGLVNYQAISYTCP